MTPDQTLKTAIMDPDGTAATPKIRGAREADAETSRLAVWTIRMLLMVSVLLVARGLMPGSEVQSLATSASGAVVELVEHQREALARAAATDAAGHLSGE